MAMHRSQLGGFIIDCEDADPETAAAFWSAALGYPAKPLSDPEDSNYRALDTGPDGLHIEVQTVDHPSRVHLDIETDTIEAEVARLEGLGAKRVDAVRTWVVMEAPTGQRFCVVQKGRANFEQTANQW
ncbi:MAG: VOC family protein [Woeseiaceae bacterium]|nr:VOC family protein [Woeseiaceae bacterium]